MVWTHNNDERELVREIMECRCEVVDIAEKVRKARLRWYGDVIRRDEGELVRDITELRDQKKIWVVDIAEKMRETRLRWYEHVIRRDEGELVRDIME